MFKKNFWKFRNKINLKNFKKIFFQYFTTKNEIYIYTIIIFLSQAKGKRPIMCFFLSEHFLVSKFCFFWRFLTKMSHFLWTDQNIFFYSLAPFGKPGASGIGGKRRSSATNCSSGFRPGTKNMIIKICLKSMITKINIF